MLSRKVVPAFLIITSLIGPLATAVHRGGPVFRNRMAAWLRWILGWIMPPISPRSPA